QQQSVARNAGVVAKNAYGPLVRLDVGDEGIDRILAGHVEHRAAPAVCTQRLADAQGALRRGGRADDARAVDAQAAGDCRAYAARGARYQCDCVAQHATALTSASASSKEAGSSSASIFRSRFLSTRRFSEVSTLPGPHSTICVAPAAIMARTVEA